MTLRPTVVADIPLGTTFYAEDYDGDCTVVDFYGIRALRSVTGGGLVLTGPYPSFTLRTDYNPKAGD